jgi:hypothetical protein
LARAWGGDLLRRSDLDLVVRRGRNFLAHRRGNYEFDPYYTFDWYMDICEENGCRAAFYFIGDHSAGAIDGDYSLTEPRIQSLLKKVGVRGHEIGMHGSYNSFRDQRRLDKERRLLVDACSRAGVESSIQGNRQHYLRWDAMETPDYLDASGFEYDTTGTFSAQPGFRYGTSHPFPMWSWLRLEPLRLVQRPLVVMECSVLGVTTPKESEAAKALDLMITLKRRSLKYGGDFTLLWHNSHLLGAADRSLFRDIIQCK